MGGVTLRAHDLQGAYTGIFDIHLTSQPSRRYRLPRDDPSGLSW